MNTDFQTINALKKEWDALQPLAPENEQRLWKKLRLEWNYHSNHIEGNTLTYGETELLLLHDQTHGNHTLREYEEMKAHDVGIAHLLTLANDKSRLIGESDSRDLNKLILKEPFWKPAQTAEGKPSRKQIIPGDYKASPNNVITATGELFEFAPPSEVPARMQALIKWLGEALDDRHLHILQIAAKLHHDFLLIHPLDDGNGRVARMLMNYVLMRQCYPPIIVPTDRKRDYLAALRLADAGDITELIEFIGSCLNRSLELAIKGAKGESLEEPGDVEKEIALFVKNQTIQDRQSARRSSEMVRSLYETSFKYLLTRLLDKMRVFDPLFAKCSVTTEPPNFENAQDVFGVFEACLQKGTEKYPYFMIHFDFDGYLGNASKSFSWQLFIALEMKELDYSWKIEGIPVIQKHYSEPVMVEEADRFVEQAQRVVFDAVKAQLESE